MYSIIYRNNSNSTQSYPPNPPTDFIATGGKQSIILTWTDPDDIELTTGIGVRWSYTRIVRKSSGYPENENDGIVVVENSTRNQYQSNGYIDSGFGYKETWYYAAFACSEDGVFSKEICQSIATTKPESMVMTINIDFNESDPTKMCSYADDAVGAPCGLNTEATEFWKEFFGYKPCLFKDGAVIGYLNPNDYSKFEDGSSASIVWNSIAYNRIANVMVEYPRRGVKMSKSGKIMTISVTDNPDAEGYTYYAHSNGTIQKDVFYLGVYIGYLDSDSNNRIRSVSGKGGEYYDNYSISYVRGRSNYSNYHMITFYEMLYIQIMYCFQFSNNLNSTALFGWSGSNATPGSGNTKGVVYGSSNIVKLFGLENPWGWNMFIDGYCCKSNYYVFTSTNNFNDAGNGYTNRGQYGYQQSGYVSDVVGSAELGFLMLPSNSNRGSTTTFLCDNQYVDSGMNYTASVCHAKAWNDGIFGFYGAVGTNLNGNSGYIGITRIAY